LRGKHIYFELQNSDLRLEIDGWMDGWMGGQTFWGIGSFFDPLYSKSHSFSFARKRYPSLL